MAQSYTRQSTFADGDTITAALFNDEYNQLLNAFAYSNTSAASTGHRHDGTAGEGGNIHTIGDLDFNNKIVVDSTNNRWGFYVEVSSAAVEQIRIQDGAMLPVTDSDVDLGTSSLYWKDAYIDSVTTTGNISIGGNLTVTGNATISGNLTFGDADTDSITLTADVASSITPDADDTYDLGSASKEWRNLYIDGTANIDSLVADTADINAGSIDNTTIGATTASTGNFSTLSIGGVAITSTAAELNILDGVTATATEINIIDGDTAATATTLADADRVVVNDAGTMKQVALTDFETYFETSLDTLSNVTTVGALNSGSITSGFGAIDTGSSNITTTGTVTFGSLADGTITITAFVDEDDMSSNSATLVPTQQSVKAYVDTQISGLSSSLSGLSDTNITSPADGALLFYDTGTSNWIDNVVSGDITIADTGVAAISSGVIVNDDINASAAISVSKTALVDGTGLTLTGDTLSVDASQTQITAVGTIATGTWQGTAIADAYVVNDLTISGGTVDNSVIGGTTAAAGTFTDLTASGTLTLGGTAVTSTATEINLLDGVTATTAEINYVDGVTSNIQTQLDSKVGANYTGDVDITGELLVDSYNETFKAPSPSVTTNPFDFNAISATGNTVNVQTNGAGDNPVGNVYWKPDGTVFWVHDHDNTPGDRIYQYTLSTAWDLSTASYDTYLSSTTAFGVQNVTFGVTNDGTVLIGTPRGSGASASQKITLTTAWDIGGGYTSNGSGDAITNFDYGYALQIKNDGTKLWALNDGGEIHQWSFGTAFDHTTLSYDSKSFTPGGTQDRSFDFNSDGTKIYVASANGQAVNEYTLSTAYDISTANSTATNTYAVGFNVALIGIDPSGSKLYLVRDALGFTVTEYDFDSAANSLTIDCESGNVFSHTLSNNTTFTFSNPPASGTTTFGTGWDLGIASYSQKSFDASSQETNVTGVAFKTDGTKMYVAGEGSDAVYQYSLSTAYDVSTASYDSVSFSVSSQSAGPSDLIFKPDGTKFYIVGLTVVYQYSLSTAWDLSTASYDSVSFSASSQEASGRGMTFNDDGTSMYIVGYSNDTVYQYTLSTAYNVGTASYASKSLSVASQETAPMGLVFNGDGTKLFVTGYASDAVYQYNLTTPYDVSTGSYANVSLDISSNETTPYAVTFADSGRKMYIAGSSSDSVFQYTTVSSFISDSTAYAMSLKVVQDSGASGYTVTWPTSVDWPSATAPTLTATASAVDQFVFYTYDGGTTWYGFTAGQALG